MSFASSSIGASKRAVFVIVGLFLTVIVLLTQCDGGMSASRAENMVRNCHDSDMCFVNTRNGPQSAFLMDKKYVDGISCRSQGHVEIVKHEPYDGGEFYLIDCRIGSELISKATVWNQFGSGRSVDLAPCNEGVCSFPQPI